MCCSSYNEAPHRIPVDRQCPECDTDLDEDGDPSMDVHIHPRYVIHVDINLVMGVAR